MNVFHIAQSGVLLQKYLSFPQGM